MLSSNSAGLAKEPDQDKHPIESGSIVPRLKIQGSRSATIEAVTWMVI
jgi:hypothetical protein